MSDIVHPVKMSLESTKELFQSVGAIAVGVVGLTKGGFTFGKITSVLGLIGEVRDIISAAPGAVPELKEIDELEAAELGALSYELVKKIVEAVKE